MLMNMGEIMGTGACAYCKTGISGRVVSCPDCGTAHCEICWSQNRSSCSAFGCRRLIDQEKAVSPSISATPPIVSIDMMFQGLAHIKLIAQAFLGGAVVLLLLHSMWK